MTGTDRTEKLTGFEALGLLTGTRRAGDWHGDLPEITGLAVDSREVRPGHIFAALPGSRMHGADFMPYALRMGAAAVLTDAAGLAMARGGGRAARGSGDPERKPAPRARHRREPLVRPASRR